MEIVNASEYKRQALLVMGQNGHGRSRHVVEQTKDMNALWLVSGNASELTDQQVAFPTSAEFDKFVIAATKGEYAQFDTVVLDCILERLLADSLADLDTIQQQVWFRVSRVISSQVRRLQESFSRVVIIVNLKPPSEGNTEWVLNGYLRSQLLGMFDEIHYCHTRPLIKAGKKAGVTYAVQTNKTLAIDYVKAKSE